MPTVGRVMSQSFDLPLKQIVMKMNRTGYNMKANGALTLIGRMRWQESCGSEKIKICRGTAQAAYESIERAVKAVVRYAENSPTPLDAVKIGAIGDIKQTIQESPILRKRLKGEIQIIEKLLQK